MLRGAKGENALFGAGFFLIAAGTAKSRVKFPLVQRLLQTFGFPHISMHARTMGEGIDALSHGFGILIDQQFEAELFGKIIPERVHFLEFPSGINMEQRKRQFAWCEGFHRQMQHYG